MSDIVKGAIKSELLVKDVVPDSRTAALQTLAKNILEVLHKHYPGHLWLVKADDEQGVVFIFNLRVSASEGYILHIENLNNYTVMSRAVVNAAGEILERYNIRRGRSNENDVKDVKRNFKGEALQK